ncbi:MAG: tryptophanase [Gemmatimonadota bacterium]|nr:tryptophanase [Gemmatimonadota bacterium]
MIHTIIEPFRIKTVEPIRMTTRDERRRWLDDAKLNVFKLAAEHVLLDFLTDSGTGAMSGKQWGAIMEGDESYAGSKSFFRLESVLKDLTGYRHIIPTHQGRAAERILFSVTTKKGDLIPNNTHFDTTRANIEYQGAEAVDLVIPEGRQPRAQHPFKGNIDLERVEDLLRREGHRIPFGMMTLTNNSGGGQPVSLANLRAYRELLMRYGKPLILDVCRYAENSMFVKLREPGMQNRTVKSIAQEMFSLADGCLMSAKKDGMVNIGGFLALNDSEWVEAAKTLLILTEGFPTYGGLAGRDLEALAVGMEEGLNEDYLRYRLRTVEYMGEKMKAAGVAIVEPTGGHAVYLDARDFLPQIPQEQYPAWSLCNALYLEAGIRGVEIGSVMFGKRNDDGTESYHAMELVRLAFPRRMYTQSHFDYAAEAICELKARAHDVRGVKMVKQARYLRHFTAEFAYA